MSGNQLSTNQNQSALSANGGASRASLIDEAAPAYSPAAMCGPGGPINHAAASAAFGHHTDDLALQSTDGTELMSRSPEATAPVPQRITKVGPTCGGAKPALTPGQQIKQGVGKAWHAIEKAFGSDAVEQPPQPAIGAPRG